LKVIWAVPVIASILILGVIGLSENVFAPQPGLEINPDSQSPGKKFRMNDPQARFSEPSTAIFRLGGVDIAEVSLKIVAQGKKASGVTPDLPGDTYNVFANTLGGTFEVDTLTIAAPPDTEPPIITASTSPAPNANGWNNSDVTTTFACVDNEGGSGVASVTGPVVVTSEGANQQLVGTCTDNAGNSATVTVTVNLDKTPPNITASTAPPPNANGWNNSDVTVSFECVDALSGVASLTSPVIVTTEGENQSVSGTCTDVAGNSSSVTVFVSLDKTVPILIITNPFDGEVLTNNLPTISGTAGPNDSIRILVDGVDLAVSVLADATGFWTFTLTETLADGPHTFGATATDLAGNVSSLESVAIFIDTTP